MHWVPVIRYYGLSGNQSIFRGCILRFCNFRLRLYKKVTAFGFTFVGGDLKQMQQTVSGLLRNDRNLYNLVMQSPVGMAIFKGRNFIVELINDQALQHWSKKRSDVIDHPVLEVVTEMNAAGYEVLLNNILNTGEPAVLHEQSYTIKSNGKPVTGYYDISLQALRDFQGNTIGILASAVDITQRVLYNRMLQESEKKYRELFNSINQGFCIIRMLFDENDKPYDYIFEEINSSFGSRTGLTDVLGKRVREIIPGNEEYWYEFYGKVAREKKEMSFNAGTEALGRWYDVFAFPTGPENENLVAVLFTDITEHKKALDAQTVFAEELKKEVKERTLELKRSNEELKQFAHVASHDLRDPLRKITMYSKLLADENINGDCSEIYIKRIQKASERMTNVIDGILRYSTVDHMEDDRLTIVNLNEVIGDILFDLEETIILKGAVINVGELPSLYGMPVRLNQLFYNLINNALKFGNSERPLEINIISRRIEQEGRQYAEIKVSDNGIGFDQAYADKIFEQFTRLHSKDQYEGTGLGLSLCRKIVRLHSGKIKAYGEPDKGATFVVTLPIG